MAIKSYNKNKGIEYKVIEKFGVLSDDEKYAKELRLVSWNGGEPKYDIRTWSTDKDGNEKAGKGITFKAEELDNLLSILKQMDSEADTESEVI